MQAFGHSGETLLTSQTIYLDTDFSPFILDKRHQTSPPPLMLSTLLYNLTLNVNYTSPSIYHSQCWMLGIFPWHLPLWPPLCHITNVEHQEHFPRCLLLCPSFCHIKDTFPGIWHCLLLCHIELQRHFPQHLPPSSVLYNIVNHFIVIIPILIHFKSIYDVNKPISPLLPL